VSLSISSSSPAAYFLIAKIGIRSRGEGDKGIFPENYGEWQEGRHLRGKRSGSYPEGIYLPGVEAAVLMAIVVSGE
jgi:hypothetical protein